MHGRERVLAVPGLCHGGTPPHPRVLKPGLPQAPNTASPSAIAALRASPLGQFRKVMNPKRALFSGFHVSHLSLVEPGRLWKLILLPSGGTHCGKTWTLWSVERGLKGHFCSCNYFMLIHICVGELQPCSEHFSKETGILAPQNSGLNCLP